jgi:amino acid transporter
MDFESEFARIQQSVDNITGSSTYYNLNWKHLNKLAIFVSVFLMILIVRPKCIYISRFSKKKNRKIEDKSYIRILFWTIILTILIWFLIKEKLS